MPDATNPIFLCLYFINWYTIPGLNHFLEAFTSFL